MVHHEAGEAARNQLDRVLPGAQSTVRPLSPRRPADVPVGALAGND